VARSGPETSSAEVVEEIRRRLDVLSEERSYAIRLGFTATDPELAADIVNAVMDVYVAAQVQAKRETILAASQEMREKVEQLGLELQTLRDQIRESESQSFVVQSGEGTISAQNLIALNDERRRLEVERAALFSDREQIADATASGRTSVLNERLVTPRLTALWQSQAEIQRNIADSATQFGPRHPRMVALESELAGLRREAQNEVQGLLRDLDRRLASLNQQAAVLDSQIRAAENEAATSAQGRASLNQLESEAESREALYNSYRERYEQTITSLDSFRSDVRVVSRAAPPPGPSSPGASMLAILGGAAGGMLAVTFIVARRYFSDSIENLDEAAAVAGHPALGSVPAVRGSLLRRPSLPASVSFDRGGAAAETLRGVILRMRVPGPDGLPPKVLMFTSAVPGDGKSSTVAAAARIAADEGLRCLAIDADFRKGNLASALRLRRSPRTLDDFLSGRKDLIGAVYEDTQSDAHFLFTPPFREVNRRFLEQPLLQHLFSWARTEYDLVLVDTPPVLRVIDPLVLTQYADATVVVISWRSVKRKTVRTAIQRLEDVGAPILGVVLSQVRTSGSEELYYSGYGKY
jgi:capsular exopolysaccharide synthesis family protein